MFGSRGKKEWFLACEDLQFGVDVWCTCWAPSNGRAFDLIAMSSGSRILIWRLYPGKLGALSLKIDYDCVLGMESGLDVENLSWSPSGMKIAAQCGKKGVWILEQEVDGTWIHREMMVG